MKAVHCAGCATVPRISATDFPVSKTLNVYDVMKFMFKLSSGIESQALSQRYIIFLILKKSTFRFVLFRFVFVFF